MADLRLAGIDPDDALLCREGWTIRELMTFIEWLPDDSAVSASVQGGPQFRGWTTDRHLRRRADLFLHAAVSKKKPKPVPLPRKARRSRGTGRVVRLRDLGGAVA